MSLNRSAFLARVQAVGKKLLSVEGLPGERLRLRVMQHFGFASRLPEGCDVVALPIGGASKHSVIIASELSSIQIELEAGDCCLYDLHGHQLRLTAAGVEMRDKSGNYLRLTDGKVETNCVIHAPNLITPIVNTNTHVHPAKPPTTTGEVSGSPVPQGDV